MRAIAATLLLLLASLSCAEDVPTEPCRAGPDANARATRTEEAERERLDELILDVAHLAEDLRVVDKLDAAGITMGLSGPRRIDCAVVWRTLQLEASIARSRREGEFTSPGALARFETEVVEPFSRQFARVRGRYDSPYDRSLYHARKALDLMLQESAEGRHSEVLRLWAVFRNLVPEDEDGPHLLEMREEMRNLASAAAGEIERAAILSRGR